MDQPTRRGVLAAAGIAATAGCSRLSGALPGRHDSPVRGESLEKHSESFTIGKGQFKAYPLSFTTQSVLLFSVVASEKIDVLAFRRPDFEAYKSDSADELPFIGELSEQSTKATAKGSDVTAGKPVIVVDNTTWAETKPSTTVDVEVELEAFVRPEHAGKQ